MATTMDTLALQLLHGTEQAAIACQEWVGRGDGKKADGAAVAAMRAAFDAIPFSGTVVIGEGEKDVAPMLYIGEVIGTGDGPAVDIAVDPLENTKACARCAAGAIAVIGAAASGSMWQSPGWYMDKVIVGPDAVGAVDIHASPEDNIHRVAEALGKPVEEVTAVVLDKPRHQDLIERLYALGTRVRLIPDGDVEGALEVIDPEGPADILLGIGGTPEGVLTACAVRLLGGDMQGALAPQKEGEEARLAEAGQRPGERLTLDDLVASDDCCFVATGVTQGALLHGPRRNRNGNGNGNGNGWETESLLITPLHHRLVALGSHVDL